MLDEIQAQTVKLFRSIGEANGVAPSKKISDEKILQISKEVMSAFQTAGEQKGEHIPGGYLMTITMKFFAVYEMAGEAFYYEHLNYEVAKYLQEGLRDEYKINLL
ncbi:MAG: hypothetical protein L0Y61_08205 [Epsilonproteobacteria bacterium]|nr:hypothetical protein [Campylobacterota bacterium]